MESTPPDLNRVPLLQNHDFFLQLPSEVAAVLRTNECIPTAPSLDSSQDAIGPWVLPGQALVCHHPRIRQLLANPQLQQLHPQHFVHPGATALHSNKELRQLLGVREYDPEQLVLLVKGLAAKGALAKLGQAWLQELLLCLFSLMYDASVKDSSSAAAAGGAVQASPREAGGTPGGGGNGRGGSGIAQGLRLKLLQELRTVPLLPVLNKPGELVAPGGLGGQDGVPAGRQQPSQRIHLPLSVLGEGIVGTGSADSKAGRTSPGKFGSPHVKR